VHGSKHRICNREDYRQLRQLAVSIAGQYVELVNTAPGKTKHSKIIDLVDAREHLQGVIKLLDGNPGAAAGKLRAFAENRLAAKTAA